MKLNKIFVCEFITGGGLCAAVLPKSLSKEGAMMRDTLLHDLLNQVETDNLTVFKCQISTTVDARLPALNFSVETTVISAKDDPWAVWEGLIKTCDAVLVIAPETDGVLLKFAQLTLGLGKKWLGCTPDAIETCGDKLKTYDFLHAHGVSIPTFSWQGFCDYAQGQPEQLFENGNRFVAKPRDGAGCEDTFAFDCFADLQQFMQQNRQASHVVQLYIAGQSASLVMLCLHGSTYLLCCNKQIIVEKNQQLSFKGCEMNGLLKHHPVFEQVAKQLAIWLPGLHGLVGIDVVVTDEMLMVLEINPRLTTSYAGLAKAIGLNPAQLCLNATLNSDFIMPALKQHRIAVHV